MVKNMMDKETKRASAYIYRGRIINLRRDTVKLPNGNETFREVVEHNGAAACLILSPERKVIFVSQYRSPFNQEVLEVPAGRIEKNEDPEETIKRELEEEVGIKPLALEKVGMIYPSPGYSDEVIHLFFTESYEKVAMHRDEDEFLEICELSIPEAYGMVSEGKIVDAKSLCLLLSCKERLMKGEN